MQPNCCVFPSPSQSKFGVNITKILLVPRQQGQPSTYYHQKYLLKQNNLSNQSNQFMHYVAMRRGKTMGQSAATTKDNQSLAKGQYSDMKSKSLAQSKEYMSQAQLIISEKHNPHPLHKVNDAIPCLFLPGLKKDKIVVFFHGNGEDISSAFQFGYFICNQLQASVLIMEYRGYSVYGGSPSAAAIVEDACRLMEFMKQQGFQQKEIILFGRSIGGAIALQVASKFQVSSLILLSPFLSLKKIAEDLYGKCASSLLKQTLDNSSIAPKVQCPVLLIHGMKDSLVPFQHSISILGQCKGYSRLKLVPNMTHVKFNFRFDFILPLKKFLNDIQVITQ